MKKGIDRTLVPGVLDLTDVLAESGDQLDSLNPQELEGFVEEVATIAKEALCHRQNYHAIVNIARSQANSQQVATVVKDQLQFEFKVLSHADLIPGQVFKDCGKMGTSIVVNHEDVESSKLILLT